MQTIDNHVNWALYFNLLKTPFTLHTRCINIIYYTHWPVFYSYQVPIKIQKAIDCKFWF